MIGSSSSSRRSRAMLRPLGPWGRRTSRTARSGRKAAATSRIPLPSDVELDGVALAGESGADGLTHRVVVLDEQDAWLVVAHRRMVGGGRLSPP
jgi:hypothetical protein